MAGKAVTQTKAASVPRKTVIKDQPHMLAYITPYEAEILMAHGGSGKPGPGGVPAFAYDSLADRFDGGGMGKSGDTYGNGDFSAADTNNDGHISAAEAEAVGGLKGGWDGDDDKGSFFGLGSGDGVDTTNINPGDRGEGGASDSSSSSSSSSTSEDAAEEVSNVESAVDRITQINEASGIGASNAEIAGILADPSGYLAGLGISAKDGISPVTAAQIAAASSGDAQQYNSVGYDPTTIQAIGASAAPTVVTATTQGAVQSGAYDVDGVQGSLSDGSVVNPEAYTIDMAGASTGINADGTVSAVGVALNDYAAQKFSKIIDTTTVSGQLLAERLGEGNYTDSKSTILGQMEIISAEFKDTNGNPRVPTWAQSLSRQVAKSIAFNNITGSAATAAMANAVMEASLGVAEKEASFFQTLTIKNLDNRQEAIINKANVLAKFEVENLTARSQAAVQNAQAFLAMDLRNVDNEQQAEIVNKQMRVDALFKDTAEENVNRRLNVQNEMDNRQFYETMEFQARQFNANSINSAKEFKADATNAAARFNAQMRQDRNQFEATMQYNVDKANATWRNEISMFNSSQAFEAHALDVRNSFSLTSEALNRMWDRTDSQLDYIWRSTEADEQRDYDLLIAELAAAGEAKRAKGSLLGSIISAGATIIAASDIRLKKNVQQFDTLPNGVKIYTWEWNEEGKRIGADQYPGFGVIAQEIEHTHPDAVSVGEHGYLMVNYGKVAS